MDREDELPVPNALGAEPEAPQGLRIVHAGLRVELGMRQQVAVHLVHLRTGAPRGTHTQARGEKSRKEKGAHRGETEV